MNTIQGSGTYCTVTLCNIPLARLASSVLLGAGGTTTFTAKEINKKIILKIPLTRSETRKLQDGPTQSRPTACDCSWTSSGLQQKPKIYFLFA